MGYGSGFGDRRNMVASVRLIKALGGGWDAAQIPSPWDLGANVPELRLLSMHGLWIFL